MGDLGGRRILVTGGSSGIGAAASRAIVGSGGAVALLARRRGPLEDLADDLGEQAVVVPGDVTDKAAVRSAVATAADRLGGLDGLVNAAGVVRPSLVGDADPEDWQVTFDVNVVGLLTVTQAVLDHLRGETPADVVNVSSMSGRRRSSVDMTVYSASKFAVHVISGGLREELADDGIRVTLVSPGYVRTPIFDDVADRNAAARHRDNLMATGLDPDVVGDQVAWVLAQPPGVSLVEIATTSARQQ